MRKIIDGYVIQTFNDEGLCVSQDFVAGDESFEDNFGESIDEFEHKVFPLEMVQPPSREVFEGFRIGDLVYYVSQPFSWNKNTGNVTGFDIYNGKKLITVKWSDGEIDGYRPEQIRKFL